MNNFLKYFLLSLLMLAISFIPVFSWPRDGFHYIFGPSQVILYGAADDVKNNLEIVFVLGKIQAAYRNLQEENEALESKIAELKNIEEENLILKEQLGLKNEKLFDRDLLLASVMGNPDDPSGTSVVIDKGSKHGLYKGLNVIRGKIVIGVVQEVLAERSVVALTTSPKVSIAAYDINSSTRTEGLVTGKYGTALLFQRILQSDSIAKGDLVVTSGKDGVFEPGFIVGKVVSVSGGSSDSLRTADLEVLVDLNKLSKVFVLM